MRVMHLISGGDSGGAKTHIFTLLQELQKEISIELVCLSEGEFYEEALALGIHATVQNQKTRFDWSVLSQIADRLNTGGFDILHCHGARANFMSVFLRSKISVPIITTVHSDYRLDFDNNIYKKLLFTPLNRMSLKGMDYYLAVTHIFEDMLKQDGYDASRIFTIYNGIDTEHWIKYYSKEKLANEGIIFGCVTRLVPIKGVHVLLDAVRICVREGYHPKVRIAGHGDLGYTRKLNQFVEDHHLGHYVEFVGFVRDVDGFYENIDVNILPSLTEGFPYVLLESGVRGIATVASRAGGIVEMIENEKDGCLFDVEDSEQLAAIMMDMMDMDVDLSQLGTAFRHKIEHRFSAKAMSKEHQRIYSTIIKNES